MSVVPDAPSDLETQKIIDKFAQYVAKNGPGFEEITRQKQFDNPKFAFLFGREFSDYYRFKLMVEIQNLSAYPTESSGGGVVSADLDPSQHIDDIDNKITDLRKQLEDSENNLRAQKQVLHLQKETKTESLYGERETKQIFALMRQVGLDVSTFETLIDHMATSGSKDTISNSKKWIFDNCQTDQLREVILTYLLYSQRKKLDNVRQMLSRYVPKLYVYASTSTTLDRSHSEKLDKLIGVWEGYKYFDENCYKLRNPANIMAIEQAQVFAARQSVAEEVERELEETYKGYEKQHTDFEQHIRAQITKLEATRQLEIEAKLREMEQKNRQEVGKRRSRFDQGPPVYFPSPNGAAAGIPSLFAANLPPPNVSSTPVESTSQAFQMAGEDLKPTCPYYELPAGMMVPLVAEKDCTFKMLNPAKLRIPAPIPPSERLLAEIDRFYLMHATPDRPRDIDGWEVNELTEHFKRKSLYRQEIESRMKDEGKTFKDAITNRFVPPTLIGDKSEERSRRRSQTPSASRRRLHSSGSSRSYSSSSSSHSSSRSRSPTKSRSRSRSTSRSPPRRRRVERSLSPEHVRAGFGGSTFSASTSFISSQSTTNFKTSLPPLNRDQNKGAQLMAKMGWEGRGLGANEQGIEEPIHGGEVRDGQDQFRGVGSKTDIFDEYRKQMSARKTASYRRRNFD